MGIVAVGCYSPCLVLCVVSGGGVSARSRSSVASMHHASLATPHTVPWHHTPWRAGVGESLGATPVPRRFLRPGGGGGHAGDPSDRPTTPDGSHRPQSRGASESQQGTNEG
jgi:hypothetical protein